MKRKQRLLSRILLPTICVLLLLPPISCLIFSNTANQYAHAKASDELDTLQQNTLPLFRNSFTDWNGPKDSYGTVPNTAKRAMITDADRSKADENNKIYTNEQVRTFLSQIGPLMQKIGGDARLIILGGEMQVVYPYDEQEIIKVASLADDFVRYIQTVGVPENGEMIELSASDGDSYLISLYRIPTKSVQLKYMITYCSTSTIGKWVDNASMLVLGISSAFALIAIAVLWVTAHSATKPLGLLCQAAERIGNGRFDTIESDFSLYELDELRMAMNRMSEQLLHSDDVQKTFFQNVSHELRNPLMSISGYAQGIEQGVFSPPNEAAHTIMVESARLTDLVNSLLTLSRMENDQQKPALRLVYIADPIEDCLDRLNGLAIKNGVSLSLYPFERSLTAWCEEDLFCTVLDNLLTNAIRYAKKVVSVSITTIDNKMKILVSDDGDGIVETDLPHIFERCYKGKGGNFGIGLAIANSAAQKMGGTLSADNQKDGGAVFTLSLMLV
ncbi:HAMP domain-containing sensor histidine kinase [Clostridium butyricum]|uniref:HAMP domain-containing sensor histidine kinase n=1 Tax=Clostridium butyricum TaxID=1492 RepID=UPI003D14A378